VRAIDIPEFFNQAEFLTDRHLREGRGGNVAIYYRDEQITYAELVPKVNQAGNALKDLGVEIENRVMLMLPDCPELVYCYLGAMKIGAVPVPVNTLGSPKDYAYFLNDSRAKVVILSEDTLPKIDAIKNELRYLQKIVVAGREREGALSLERILARASTALEAERTSKDDMALWMYTSGTTGVPKAVVHLHHDLLHYIVPICDEILQATEKDRVFVTSKMFFAYSRNHSLELPLTCGAATILVPDWPNPQTVFETIEKYKPTLFFSVPTFYNNLLKEAESSNSTYDLSSVRACFSAGEPLPEDIYLRWKARFGLPIINGVGSTDSGGICISSPPDQIKPGSSGKLLPGFEGKLLSEVGEDVPCGEVGVLWLKNDGVASVYWNKHQRSKEVFQGPWFNTGDLFYQDNDGYLWYQGRADDMMKVSGQWVSPVEIENVLLQHAAVNECGIVGAPDQSGLLKVKAFIVLNEGYRSSSELENDLKDFVRGKMAHFKAPRWVQFLPSLPRTTTGKLQRHKLRQL
jgi:benzoate-CoA ligase family protein